MDTQADLFTLLKNKHVLIAVDDSESSLKAVRYTAQMLAGRSDLTIVIMCVVSIMEDDAFVAEVETIGWIRHIKQEMRQLLENCKALLISAGFASDQVFTRLVLKDAESVAHCIAREHKSLGAATIVLGRRGISRKEEFLFGSTSSKLIHLVRDCAVWVVE